jgi:hypothetical protein
VSPNSRPSHGLTPELVARFTAAQDRWKKTSIESGASAVTTPGGGTPVEVVSSSGSLIAAREVTDDLFERLARLATTEPPEGRPPLETYTTTPTANGDVYRATDAYRAWLRSRYRGYGVGDHSAVTPPRSVAETLGGATAPVKKGRYQPKAP